MKYWEILLQKQRERGKSGLTIPFIIGSQSYISETSQIQNVRELILDMIKTDSFIKCLRYCMGTKTFIIEIKKDRNAIYYPRIDEKEQKNFSIGLFDKKIFTEDSEKMILELESRFQEPIEKGFFSAVPNVNDREVNWEKFSKDDISFIKMAFEDLAIKE